MSNSYILMVCIWHNKPHHLKLSEAIGKTFGQTNSKMPRYSSSFGGETILFRRDNEEEYS